MKIDKKGRGRHADAGPKLPEKKNEKLIKVRMLETRKHSPDGIHVDEYRAGEKYGISESLAKTYLRNEWAEEDKVLDVPKETKSGRRKK